MNSGDRLGQKLIDDIDAYIATLTLAQKTFSDPAIRIALQKVIGGAHVPQIGTISGAGPHTLSNLPWYKIFYCTVGTNSITVNMEDAANCEGCIVKFIILDTNTGKIILDGNGSQTLSGFLTFELWGLSGNSVEFISDGSNWIKLTPDYWKKIVNPGTDYFTIKTVWVTADNFTSGNIELNYANFVPNGTKSVYLEATTRNGNGNAFWRAYGDTNISNTPSASLEYSHMFNGNAGNVFVPVTFDLSIDYKAQVTVSTVDVDVYICYHSFYLQ